MTTSTEVKLNPEIKTKWLEALRSGEYEQGKGYLHYEDQGEQHYCCLGVLCEIAVEQGVISPGPSTPGGDDPLDSDHDAILAYGTAATTMPPDAVTAWALDLEPDSYVSRMVTWSVEMPEGHRRGLPELNDDDDLSFTEIADLIEQSL